MRPSNVLKALYNETPSAKVVKYREWVFRSSLIGCVVGGACAVIFGRGFGDGFVALWLILSLVGFTGLMVAMPWHFLTRRAVWRCSLLLLALAIIFPPRGSKDVYSYASYGRMVSQYQVSPYTHSPFDYPGDAWSKHVSSRWIDTPSVYGPVFTAVSAIGMQVAGESILVGRLFFQGLAVVSMLGTLILIDRKTRGDPIALGLVALNPGLVIVAVNGGHNDVIVGFLLLLACMKAIDGKFTFASVTLAIAALVKATAGLAILAVIIWLAEKYGRRVVIRFTAQCAAIGAVGYMLVGGPRALAPLANAGRYNMAGSSFWSAVSKFLTGEWTSDTTSRAAARDLATGLVSRSAGLTLVILAVAVVVARKHFASPALPIGAAMLAFCFTTPWMLPWYIAGALPLLALHWQSRLSKVGFAYSVLFVAAYARGSRPPGITKSVLGALYWSMPIVHIVLILGLFSLAAARVAGKWPKWLGPAGKQSVTEVVGNDDRQRGDAHNESLKQQAASAMNDDEEYDDDSAMNGDNNDDDVGNDEDRVKTQSNSSQANIRDHIDNFDHRDSRHNSKKSILNAIA